MGDEQPNKFIQTEKIARFYLAISLGPLLVLLARIGTFPFTTLQKLLVTSSLISLGLSAVLSGIMLGVRLLQGMKKSSKSEKLNETLNNRPILIFFSRTSFLMKIINFGLLFGYVCVVIFLLTLIW